MRIRRAAVLTVLLSLAAGVGSASAHEFWLVPDAFQIASVARVVAAFHAALARADSAAALVTLAADVTIMESGDVQGLGDYRAHHLAADIAFARAVPSTTGPLSVTVVGDAAWVTSTSTTVGSFNGRAVNSTGAELMVLSKDSAGEWRIRAIHWSSHRR